MGESGFFVPFWEREREGDAFLLTVWVWLAVVV